MTPEQVTTLIVVRSPLTPEQVEDILKPDDSVLVTSNGERNWVAGHVIGISKMTSYVDPDDDDLWDKGLFDGEDGD